MTTYYRLDIFYDGAWRPRGTRFPFELAATMARNEIIADPEHCGHELIVEQGCPTRIMKITEEVVQEFPGLPVEGEA